MTSSPTSKAVIRMVTMSFVGLGVVIEAVLQAVMANDIVISTVHITVDRVICRTPKRRKSTCIAAGQLCAENGMFISLLVPGRLKSLNLTCGSSEASDELH